MPVPTLLKSEAEAALTLIEQDPQHEYGPARRKRLNEVWKRLKDPTADRAYKCLMVITAQKVLPFYALELQPEAQALFNKQIPEFTDEELRQHDELEREIAEMPHKAIDWAKELIRGKGDKNEARQYSSNQHHVVGNLGDFFLLPRANFVNHAAHVALRMASTDVWHGEGVFDPFKYIDDDVNKTDFEWLYSGYGGDVASYAAAAWSYDPQNKQLQSDRLLEFWRWWLLEAIPQAWTMTEQVNGEA